MLTIYKGKNLKFVFTKLENWKTVHKNLRLAFGNVWVDHLQVGGVWKLKKNPPKS